MRVTISRITALIFASIIAGSAAAQQAATAPSDVGPAPSWDVLMRGRTHVPTPTTAAITAADLRTRLYIFADDSMQGRLLATAGNVKAVEYIAAEVKRMGLTPMGDNGTYFQTVNVVDRKFDAAGHCIQVNLCSGDPKKTKPTDDCLQATEERAWSSPIWYVPGQSTRRLAAVQLPARN